MELLVLFPILIYIACSCIVLYIIYRIIVRAVRVGVIQAISQIEIKEHLK